MKPLIYLMLFCCVAAGCEKESVCEDELTTLKYFQTGCADPWVNGTDSTTLTNVGTYLQGQGLFAANISIQADMPAQVCLACNCKTGKTIYVRTFNDPVIIARFTQIGFAQ